jgi:hypothetical protein
MQVLFIHGMGRTPVSGWPMLNKLKRAGLKTETFAYSATFESFSTIKTRLIEKIETIASKGDYIVVAHSLGGVLLRATLNSLPEKTERPVNIFLLGSPIQPSRIAQRLKNNLLYKSLTGECGQILGSKNRMTEFGEIKSPVTSIVGDHGIFFTKRLFSNEQNDGIVAISEVSANWLKNQIHVPTHHSLLPSSKHVTNVILQQLAQMSSLKN